MKKLVSVVLVLVLVLSVGPLAFANSSAVHITKNPSDEVRFAGDTAIFISGASGYSKLTWNFVSPDEKVVTVQEFRTLFPYATVEGESGTTLTVKNLSTAMNGWSVFCAFSNGETEVDTTLAYLYVSVYTASATPTPAVSGTTTTTYYTYYIPVYGNDDDDMYVYVDEFGTFTPAHPDADEALQYLQKDEYGYYMPAHPDAYDYGDGTCEDEFGSFTPAHPDADGYDDFLYEDEFGYFMPAHPDAF